MLVFVVVLKDDVGLASHCRYSFVLRTKIALFKLANQLTLSLVLFLFEFLFVLAFRSRLWLLDFGLLLCDLSLRFESVRVSNFVLGIHLLARSDFYLFFWLRTHLS